MLKYGKTDQGEYTRQGGQCQVHMQSHQTVTGAWPHVHSGLVVKWPVLGWLSHWQGLFEVWLHVWDQARPSPCSTQKSRIKYISFFSYGFCIFHEFVAVMPCGFLNHLPWCLGHYQCTWEFLPTPPWARILLGTTNVIVLQGPPAFLHDNPGLVSTGTATEDTYFIFAGVYTCSYISVIMGCKAYV